MKRNVIALTIVLIVGWAFLVTKLSSPFGLLFQLGYYFVAVSSIGLLICLGFYLFHKRSGYLRVLSFLTLITSTIFTIIFLVMAWDYRILLPITKSRTLTPEELTEDFDELKSIMKTHPGYTPEINSVLLLGETKNVMMNPAVNRNNYIGKISSLLGMFHDGHSYVPTMQIYNKSRYLPLAGFLFEDGFIITRTSDEYETLKNKKLIAINGFPLTGVLEKIAKLTGPENLSNELSRINNYIFSANTLFSLGIIPTADEAALNFIDENGRSKTLSVASEPFINWVFWFYKPIHDRLPVLPNLRKPNYQLHIRNENAELELNLIQNISDVNSIKTLAEELDKLIINGKIKSVIFDLRNNTGGNNQIYAPLIEVAKKYDQINRPSRLYALVSRHTFSAGVNFLDELRFETNATLIGEPAGAGANHFGDANLHRLSNSGVYFFVSSKTWKSRNPSDTTNAILPDYSVDYFSQDYFLQKDPWMDIIDSLNYEN